MRRCFWASFITQCINADHSLGFFHDDRIMSSPLPIGERSFTNGVQEPLLALVDVIKESPAVCGKTSACPSLMAELVTLIWYWEALLFHLSFSANRSAGPRSATTYEVSTR
jgi:hypothetical protein